MSWKLMLFLLQVHFILTTQLLADTKSSFSNQTTAIHNLRAETPGILSPVGEPETEPEPEVEPKPEEGWGEAEDWPEPGPLWEEAYEKWGAAWEVHIYGFCACFLFVFIYALYYVVVNIQDGLRKKYLSVSLNVMMAICGFSRSLVLAIDPYHQGTGVDTPLKFMRILWSLTDPCLTAADSLVILALLETYKLSIAPQRLQRPSAIFPVIIVHFTFVFVSDLVVSEYLEAKAMLVFCQVFFITWCAILGIAYFLIGYKLDKLLFQSSTDNEISQEGRWYIYLIHTSGVSNIVTSSVYIYSAAGVFGVYSDVEYVEAWPWWSLQTALRITELIAAVLVFTVSAKRAKPARNLGPSDRVEDGASAPEGRKRKLSMFSAMRAQRNNINPYMGKDDQPSGNTEFGEQGVTGVRCKDEPPEATQLERKDSMFTVLHDKTNVQANRSDGD